MVNIQDALNILPKLNLVAGKEGVKRQINVVNIFDSPDIKNWLSGGELILTTGYNYREQPEMLVDIIGYLSQHNSAGLGIVIGQFIDKLPKSVVNKANELNVPLIVIPPDLSWSNIIVPLMIEISNEQTSIISRSLKIHNFFNTIALNDNIIQNTLNKLYEITHICTVYYNDEENALQKPKIQYNQEYVKNLENLTDSSSEIILDVPKNNTATILTENKYIVTPVIINNKTNGYIIGKYNKPEINKLDIIAFERAAINIAIDLLKQKAVNAEKRRYQDDFLLEILTGKLTNPKIIQRRAQFYNLDFTGTFNIIDIDIDNFSNYIENVLHDNQNRVETLKKSIDLIITNIFRNYNIPIIKYITSDCFILIVNSRYVNTENPNNNTVYNILNEIKQNIYYSFKDLTVSIGISKTHDSTDLHKGYSEAKQVLNIGKKINGKDFLLFYSELGIYAFLMQENFEEHLETFYTHTIKKIVDYDKKKESELLTTLINYLDYMNIPATADAMFVHPNTIRYRMKKIEELTNCNLKNSNDRIKLEIGIKINQLL